MVSLKSQEQTLLCLKSEIFKFVSSVQGLLFFLSQSAESNGLL